MPRPRLFRRTHFNPHVTYFKPSGVPMRTLEIVDVSIEEMEAYRLRHLMDLDQKTASEHMQTSPSTYQRILYSASKKIADALVHGKAISIVQKDARL